MYLILKISVSDQITILRVVLFFGTVCIQYELYILSEGVRTHYAHKFSALNLQPIIVYCLLFVILIIINFDMPFVKNSRVN